MGLKPNGFVHKLPIGEKKTKPLLAPKEEETYKRK